MPLFRRNKELLHKSASSAYRSAYPYPNPYVQPPLRSSTINITEDPDIYVPAVSDKVSIRVVTTNVDPPKEIKVRVFNHGSIGEIHKVIAGWLGKKNVYLVILFCLISTLALFLI